MGEHPSTFALDVLALGNGTAEAQAHVASCAQCQVQLQQLTGGPVVLPPDLRVRALERRSGGSRWRWLGGGFALAAAAALVLLVAPPGSSLRTKGGPSLELFVKRGDTVQRWDARSPVAPGDRLLLRVDAAGYTHTRVLTGTAVLFEGELPADRSKSLPLSFKVDDADGAEHLRVELSGGGQPDWATELELPKDKGSRQ